MTLDGWTAIGTLAEPLQLGPGVAPVGTTVHIAPVEGLPAEVTRLAAAAPVGSAVHGWIVNPEMRIDGIVTAQSSAGVTIEHPDGSTFLAWPVLAPLLERTGRLTTRPVIVRPGLLGAPGTHN